MAEDFAIYYHYGGRLTKLDGDMHYLGGNIKRRHHIDPDKFGFLDLKDDIEAMGYVNARLFLQNSRSVSYRGVKRNA